MRTVIILTMSALGLLAVPALAQQTSDQVEAARREQLRAVQAQLEARRAAARLSEASTAAQLQALKAELAAAEATLDKLRQRYTDNYPEVAVAKAKLEELRAREAELTQGLQRALDAPASLKQSGGGLQTGLADLWWKNPAAAQYLGLTADQQRKMDDVFQQSRSTLMNLNYALEREEARLEHLVAEPLDESGITAQIDRVAQARAELEKANGRMLLGIRKQLTPEQWSKVSQISSLAQPGQK